MTKNANDAGAIKALAEEIAAMLPAPARGMKPRMIADIVDTIERKKYFSGAMIGAEKRGNITKTDRGIDRIKKAMLRLADEMEKLPPGLARMAFPFSDNQRDPAAFLRESAEIGEMVVNSMVKSLPKTAPQLIDDIVLDLAEVVRVCCNDPHTLQPQILTKASLTLARKAAGVKIKPGSDAGVKTASDIVRRWNEKK